MTTMTDPEASAPADEEASQEGRAPRARLPQQAFTRPVAERREMGRVMRDQAPRKNLADWKPAANRKDPVDLILRSEEGRLEDLLPIRHSRMLASPFAFYRGTAILQAADLGNAPSTSLQLWACGDAHLVNFGGFATPERRMVFDINDFDEVSVAPFEWDLKRLAASFVVAARDRGFGNDIGRQAAWTAVNIYRQRINEYATAKVLDTWYASVDLIALINASPDKEMRRSNLRMVEAAQQRSARDIDYEKLAVARGEQPRIKDQPPLIFHMAEMQGEEFERVALQAIADYRASLPPERRPLVSRYEFKDAAMKVVGVGSVGTFCGILLLMSGNGDPLFLQFKQANASVLEQYAGASPYKHHGQRVVVGQRIMQSASDIFLGWFTGTGPGKREFYVRQLRDAKVAPQIELMKAPNLVAYATACGMTLAQRARADPATLRCSRGTWARAPCSRTRSPPTRWPTPTSPRRTTRRSGPPLARDASTSRRSSDPRVDPAGQSSPSPPTGTIVGSSRIHGSSRPISAAHRTAPLRDATLSLR